MQEYAKMTLNFKNEEMAKKALEVVQEFLQNYEYEEPEKCNWSDYLKVKNKSVVIESDAMCGWLDYPDMFKKLCKKIADVFTDANYNGDTEFVNISSGFTFYMNVEFAEKGLIIKESTICCEYCGCPIFGDDIIFMRNEDEERVIALCSEECKTRFFEEECDDEEEWVDSTREEYDEENGF